MRLASFWCKIEIVVDIWISIVSSKGSKKQFKEEFSHFFPSWNWEKDKEHYTLVEEGKKSLPNDKKKEKQNITVTV